MLKEVFDVNNYLVFGDKIRELWVSFQEKEALHITKAWNYSDSLYASLNDILSTMKKSGWTKEISDDECLFQKKVSTDDKEDVPLSYLENL